MYEQFFNLKRTPFRLHSEPELFFSGKSQQNAMNSLREAIASNRSVFTLFGLPGTGKTTLVQKVVSDNISADTLVYRLSRAENNDIRISIAQELSERLSDTDEAQRNPVDVVSLFRAIERSGRDGLLVIDEAQLLTKPEVDFLHELAATDFNGNLLKLILIGHTEARDLVKFDNDLSTTNTQVIHASLEPLSSQELRTYVEHRLVECGWKNDPQLSNEIYSLSYQLTQGFPRRVNAFFDRLLQYMEFDKLHEMAASNIDAFCKDLYQELSTLDEKLDDETEMLNSLAQHLGENSQQQAVQEQKQEPSQTDINIKGSSRSETSSEKQPIEKNVEAPEAKQSVAKKEMPPTSTDKVPTKAIVEEEKTAVESRIDQINQALQEGSFGIDRAKHKLVDLDSNKPVAEKVKTTKAKNKIKKADSKSTLTKANTSPSPAKPVKAPVAEKVVQQKPVATKPAEVKKEKPSAEVVAKPEPQKLAVAKTVIRQKKEPVNKKSAVAEKSDTNPLKRIGIAAGVVFVGVLGVFMLGDDDEPVRFSSTSAPTSIPMDASTGSQLPKKEVADMALFESTESKVAEATPIAEKKVETVQSVTKSTTVESKDKPAKFVVSDQKPQVEDAKTVVAKKTESPKRQQVAVTKKTETKQVSRVKETPKKDSQPSTKATNSKVIVAKKIEPKKRLPQVKPEEAKKKPAKVVKTENKPVVAKAIPKREPVSQEEPKNPPVAVLTDKELRGMLTSFKWFYESGDVNMFSKLFTEDARTNDNVVGREAIRKDYGALFAATDSRLIEVRNINWKKNGESADGNGLFKLTVINKANGEANEINGQIFIRAEKDKNKKRAKIKGLFYQYNLASK